MVRGVKYPLTYEEQIKRLKDFHKLSIDDDEEALLILKKINYYRLSG
jgi:abortive infection bacteriophage resistance protein